METVRRTDKIPRARITLVAALSAMLVVPTTRVVLAADMHKVTLVLREYKFEPDTIRLKVGEEVELTIQNPGRSAHEWLAGSGLVKQVDGKGFQKDLFALLDPSRDGRRYSLERGGLASKAESIPRISSGLRLEPGGEVTLHFTVPESARGEWQMACFFSGHYEKGMKGTLVIE